MIATNISRLCQTAGNIALKYVSSKGFSSYPEPSPRIVSKVSDIVAEHFSNNVRIIKDMSLCEQKTCYCKLDPCSKQKDPFLCQQIEDPEALAKAFHLAVNNLTLNQPQKDSKK